MTDSPSQAGVAGYADAAGTPDARRTAGPARRNREPLRRVLARVLPARAHVLELASGTGEHATFFARYLPWRTWQPSDPDPAMRASIAAHIAAEGVGHAVAPPLALDAREPWPVARADAVLAVNLLHIAPRAVTPAVLAGAARVLSAGGLLIVYGPFTEGGVHTGAGNARFDAELRARDPELGLRDIDAVARQAHEHGLRLDRRVRMPANNRTLLFRRAACTSGHDAGAG